MDDEDELFDWATQAYEKENPPPNPDWSQYEVYLGTIDKDPATGEETLTGFEVRRKQ